MTVVLTENDIIAVGCFESIEDFDLLVADSVGLPARWWFHRDESDQL